MILEKIVYDNLPDLEDRKRSMPLADLKKMVRVQPPPLDFAKALKGDSTKLIAEVKKASPSRGVIRADFDPVAIARIYVDNGAAAISVLTEEKYFQGSLDYLRAIKEALGNKVPILRKDFIHDPYQVYEARVYGADALLLIVAILSSAKLQELLEMSYQLGMSCLIEVHNEAELQIALKSRARIIGINNRDLRTFTVDLNVTARLRPLIPSDRTVVSESGINKREDMAKMKKLGVNAVLIGEAFMSAEDIGAKMKDVL